MSLSVYIVTRDSAGHIERLLRSIREVADELFRLEPFGNTMAITRAG